MIFGDGMIRVDTQIRVEFFDVDSMQVVWHGNYVKYLEIARCNLLNAVGYNYQNMKEEGFAFPIVKMELKYIHPSFFGDILDVQVALNRTEILQGLQGSLKLYYSLKKGDTVICKGYSMQACVNLITQSTQYTLPTTFIERLKNFKGDLHV